MRLINIGSIALNHSEGHRMGSRLLKKPVLGGLWNLYGFFHFFLHLRDFFLFVILGDFCEYKFFDRVKLIEGSDKIYWKIGKRYLDASSKNFVYSVR